MLKDVLVRSGRRVAKLVAHGQLQQPLTAETTHFMVITPAGKHLGRSSTAKQVLRSVKDAVTAIDQLDKGGWLHWWVTGTARVEYCTMDDLCESPDSAHIGIRSQIHYVVGVHH